MQPSSQCSLYLGVAREPGFRYSLRYQYGLYLNVACILIQPGPWAYCSQDLGIAYILIQLYLSVACTSVWPIPQYGSRTGISVWPWVLVQLIYQYGLYLNVAYILIQPGPQALMQPGSQYSLHLNVAFILVQPIPQYSLYLSVARELGFRCGLRSQCSLYTNMAYISVQLKNRDFGIAWTSVWPVSQCSLQCGLYLQEKQLSSRNVIVIIILYSRYRL